MKIGVISDSHKNLDYLRRAITLLLEEGVSCIVHLGDDYKDTVVLDECPVRIIKVPGAFDPEYKDRGIQNRLIEEIEGVRILITHTIGSHKNDLPDDIRPEDVIQKREVDLVLFGHTHLYEMKEEAGIICFNPGHLQEIDTKKRPASFGVVEITDSYILCRLFDLKKNKISEKRFDRCQEG
jgi:hypothetical protein